MFISNKIDFKTKTVTRYKEEEIDGSIKGSIQEGDIKIVNKYTHNTGFSNSKNKYSNHEVRY